MVLKKTMLGVMIGIMGILLYFVKNLVCSRFQSSKICHYTNVKLTKDNADQDDNSDSEIQILNNVEDLNTKLEGMEKIIDKLE